MGRREIVRAGSNKGLKEQMRRLISMDAMMPTLFVVMGILITVSIRPYLGFFAACAVGMIGSWCLLMAFAFLLGHLDRYLGARKRDGTPDK